MAVTIRASEAADLPAITAIYAHYVISSTATFELDPPSEGEMQARREDVLGKGLPYLVAVLDSAVVGYAYCQWFKARPAYRHSAEISVYLDPAVHRRGIGRTLLSALIESALAAGVRKLIAVIGDSGNAASIGLHTAMGFTHAGVIRSCGWKFSRWLDIVLMDRFIGEGDTTAPDAEQQREASN